MLLNSIVHLDSITASLLTDNTNSTGVKKSYYNCQFNLNNTYKDVKNVKLLSLELPVGFYNIRAGMNEFRMCFAGVFYVSYIPVGNYYSIAEINNAVSEIFYLHPSGYNMVSVVENNKIRINAPLATFQNVNWYIADTIFSNNILGIFSTDLPMQNVGIIGSGRWNLSIDNYISLYISELGTNGNNQKITFKIPLPVATSQILYLTENIFYTQKINCNIASLNTLTCKFFDRFGFDLTSLGYAWSASLEITSG